MTKILKEVGERIRSLRKASELSQQALAERAGISYKYLGEVERGQVNLSVEILMKIAKALHIGAGDILDDADQNQMISRANFIISELSEKSQRLALKMLEALRDGQ